MDEFSNLIRRARGGDPEAFSELHRRYEQRVVARIRERIPGGLRVLYDSADLAQSVFLEALRGLAGFEDRGERAFRNWLYLKAESKVRYRIRQFLRKGEDRDVSLEALSRIERALPEPGPRTRAEQAEAYRVIAGVLDGIDPADRQIVRLRAENDLSFREIAEWLELASADAARMRYARALVRIRAALRDA